MSDTDSHHADKFYEFYKNLTETVEVVCVTNWMDKYPGNDNDDLVFNTPFNIKVISRHWKGDNEMLYSHELNSISSGIQTRDLIIASREG